MRLSFCIFLLIIVQMAQGQPGSVTSIKYFDIRLAGVKIGELKATRTVKDTITAYRLESKVKVWLVVSVEMEHLTETVYHGEKLFTSTSVSRTNSGTYTSSITLKDGYYQTQVDSYKYKNSTPIYEMVECNIARFYFDEPVTIRKTLADSYGTLATIKKVNPGDYEVDSHGNVNQYRYKNGSLVSASLFSKIRYEVVARNDNRLASAGVQE
jgi:hypothetical protein